MSGICDTCKIKSRCISPEGGLLACQLYEQDRKSKWFELFGTPERAARTLEDEQLVCAMQEYDALLEWLRGESDGE